MDGALAAARMKKPGITRLFHGYRVQISHAGGAEFLAHDRTNAFKEDPARQR